ncbi:Cx9C motif-containing protein 4, mitochondrial [Bulinus truncatus]|nr:Cx9C motif-containing protein 4, mitochondrial [Bulinus truncatus]
MPLQDPCQKFACDLQNCLRANDYQEWKCQHIIEALYDCCSRCGKGNSAVCSGIVNPANTPETQVAPLRYSHGKILPDEPTFLENTPTILSLESIQHDNCKLEIEEIKEENVPTFLLPTIADLKNSNSEIEESKAEIKPSKAIREKKPNKSIKNLSIKN